MIVRMSKIEIVGPKGLLEEVLSLLKQLGIIQIEPATIGFIEKGCEDHVRSFLPDEATLSQMLFFEDLKAKIDEIFSYLPAISARKSYIEPVPILDTISKNAQRHVVMCKELFERREKMRQESNDLNRYSVFLTTLSSLMKSVKEAPDLDFIGLTIREPAMVGRIRDLISRLTDFRFELFTEGAEDGTIVGLITIEKGLSEKIKRTLSDERIPELGFPSEIGELTLSEKCEFIRKRISDMNSGIEGITGELERFALRWGPIYARVKEWLQEKLSLLKTTASVFETRMCFFIDGWVPTNEVNALRRRLIEAFKGQVAIEEKGMLEEDLERVPIALRNPAYFQPFELLVRLLPLPKYTSFDPTPFIGIFFPVFFGMILGDAGYGILLLSLAYFFMKRFRRRREFHDASKILVMCSVYAIFFGILYGEYFGELGHKLFGLTPLCIERRSAVIPILYFALTVGVVHVSLGLFLGFLSALRRHLKKEAAFKLLNILVIICVLVIVVSFIKPFPWLLARPAIIAIMVLTPLLFFTGGLLAPLELLKNIGNIISYARIMAIGLASVLLAFVANRLAGMTGDIVMGIIVAGLLHIINIILGVFSPAIHSLRLHYVEFFTKFIEHGGRRFEPLKK